MARAGTFSRLLLLAALVLPFPLGSQAASSLDVAADVEDLAGSAPAEFLANFAEVGQGIFRGAQPREGDLERLAAMGIRTIVNLRGGRAVDQERAAAEALGLRFVTIPMSPTGAPRDEEVRRVLDILLDPASHPVFVHCLRGADRTGVAIGCYRIASAGYTPERALAEAKEFDFSPIQSAKRRYLLGACGESLRGLPGVAAGSN